VATLYDLEVEKLAPHEAVALVLFQQSLVAVLLIESAWPRQGNGRQTHNQHNLNKGTAK
jgi:hypothetical protein